MMQTPQKPGILLAASYALRVHAFDISTGQTLEEFEILNSQANRIVTIGNEPTFFVGAYSYIFGYDFQSRNRKHSQGFMSHEGNVTDIVATPTQLLSCGEDKTIKVWDRRTTKASITIPTTSALNSIILMPSNNTCTVCDENGVVSLYDLRQSARIQKTESAKVPVRSLAIAPDGTYFVAANQDGTTVCYSIEGDGFKEHYRIQSHNDTQLRCAVAPNSKTFATSAADNSARIWNIETGDMKQSCMAGEAQEWTWDIAFTSDSAYLCTGGSDCSCRLWDVENGRMVMQMPQLPKCVSAIAILNA